MSSDIYVSPQEQMEWSIKHSSAARLDLAKAIMESALEKVTAMGVKLQVNNLHAGSFILSDRILYTDVARRAIDEPDFNGRDTPLEVARAKRPNRRPGAADAQPSRPAP